MDLLMLILSGSVWKKVRSDSMAGKKYVVFKLGEQIYSMDLLLVKGIEQSYNIIPIPIGPENIKGIINLRGDVIPVFSLRSKFNMDENFDGDTRKLLVTFTHGIQLAFEVDAVVGIKLVDEKDINDIPVVVKTQETVYMDNILNIGDGIIISISVENIISKSEIDHLSEIIDDSN